MKTPEEKVLDELASDPKGYLINCKNNYSEYISIAQELFKESYLKIQIFDSKGDAWTKYNSKAEEFKKKGNEVKEIEILENGIHNEIYTPGTYERLAIIYITRKEFDKALDVCRKWFNSPFWFLPNGATTSLRLFETKENLEKKINVA